MKRIKNLALSLSLAGSLLLGVVPPQAAVALSDAEVMSRLNNVPVFLLLNDKGNTIFSAGPDTKTAKPVFLYFFSHKDAEAQVSKLKPEEAKKVQVLPLALGEVIGILEKNKDNKDAIHTLQPNEAQRSEAIDILVKNGDVVLKDGKPLTKDGKPLNLSVPLFFPVIITDGKASNLLIARDKEEKGKVVKETVLPVFLNSADIQPTLDNYKKSNPDAKTEIRVMDFTVALESLYEAKSDAEVTPLVELVPSTQSLLFVNWLQKNGEPAPGQTPPKKSQ